VVARWRGVALSNRPVAERAKPPTAENVSIWAVPTYRQ
jgi:hypothetical protein